MSREIISTGNELAAFASIDAGCEFFGGYPLTPSSEVMHTLSDMLPANGGAANGGAAAGGAAQGCWRGAACRDLGRCLTRTTLS